MGITKLKSVLRRTWLRIFRLGENDGTRIPRPESLAWMDVCDGDTAEDTPVNEEERRGRLRYFTEVIGASGIGLNGPLLDLASGTTSLADLYPDTVAVDSDLGKAKILRRDGIEAIVADIENLPFRNNAFDYVVSFSPPQKPIISHCDGCCHFMIDQEYNRKLVQAAIRIARKKVLFDSYCMALQPPYEHLIESRDNDHHHYVLYRASNESL